MMVKSNRDCEGWMYEIGGGVVMVVISNGDCED